MVASTAALNASVALTGKAAASTKRTARIVAVPRAEPDAPVQRGEDAREEPRQGASGTTHHAPRFPAALPATLRSGLRRPLPIDRLDELTRPCAAQLADQPLQHRRHR